MEVFETEKRISWKMRLEAMEVGDKIPVSIKSANTARQEISKLKLLSDHPYDFETNTKETPGVMTIKRTA